MANGNNNELAPDTLLERFQGVGLKRIAIFTLVVHVVVIGGSSLPYLAKSVFGANRAGMTRDERIQAAVKEATAAIRDIAADYQLNSQEISDQFSGGRSRAAAAAAVEAEPEETQTTVTEEATAESEAERPKSEIEMAIEVEAEGPAAPTFDDDIF